MRLPICSIDARTGSLCRKCKQLLQEEKITDLDVELSSLFVNLEKKYKDLSSLVFYNSIDLENVAIIIVKKEDILLLSKPEIIEEITNKAHKKVRFLEYTKNAKTLVEKIIEPIPIINLTTLFLPPFGDKEYKVEIDKKHKNSLPVPESLVIEIVSSILGSSVYIDFV